MSGLYGVPDVAAHVRRDRLLPYSHKARGTLDQVRTLRGDRRLHGDDVDLWVTELGWASAGKRRWGLVKTRPDRPAARERARAAAGNADGWDVRGDYWCAWRDTDRGAGVCGWCPWSGLIDRVGREKPAYATCATSPADD